MTTMWQHPTPEQIRDTLKQRGPLTTGELLEAVGAGADAPDDVIAATKRLIGLAKRWGQILQVKDMPITFAHNPDWKPGYTPLRRAEPKTHVEAQIDLDAVQKALDATREEPTGKPEEPPSTLDEERAPTPEHLSAVMEAHGPVRWAITAKAELMIMRADHVIEFSPEETKELADLLARYFGYDPGEYVRRAA